MTLTARVKWFDAAQGFGFIEDDGGDIFVHRSEVSGGDGLAAGDLVEFDLRGGLRGRAACHVRVCDQLELAGEPLPASAG